MDSFEPEHDPDWTTYTQLAFRTDQGSVTKDGKLCYQTYDLKHGQQKPSGLEIMANYEQAMATAGAKITNSQRAGDDDIYATLTKDGAEYWFYIWESNGDRVNVKEIQVAPFKSTMIAP